MSRTENSGQTSGRRFTAKQVIGLLAVASLLAGAVGATVVLTSQRTVTINEPLVITPGTQPLSIYAGENINATWSVADLASVVIPASITATITPSACGTLTCSPNDVTATVVGVCPTPTSCTGSSTTNTGSVNFQPGGNNLVINVFADTHTVNGTYTLSISVTR